MEIFWELCLIVQQIVLEFSLIFANSDLDS
uniref:Uncharacterized protein n=1 Tax=Rhizophora mucronata TaxID=61149 RepID=A0A2P2KPA3_RHIMU